jgi:ADP-ribose pyrophosphatase YjhB (NUDIX family)
VLPDTARLPTIGRDRRWHRALIFLVRFRAWLMWSVYTSGSLALVVRDDGRFLLVKPHYRGAWGFVGGYLKPGEQPIEAMRRELAEEVGMTAEVVGPLASYVQPRRRHIDHLFVVRAGAADTIIDRRRLELSDAAWFPPDELPELQLEAHVAFTRLADL